MKRLGGWMFDLLAVVSVLLWLVVGVTWIRSYFSFSERVEISHSRMVGKVLRISSFQLYLAKGAIQYGSSWYDISGVNANIMASSMGGSPWKYSYSDVGGVLYISPPNYSVAGIAISYTPALPARGQVAQIDARVPYWTVLAGLSFWPILWIARFIHGGKMNRRRMRGCCVGCGYDLRATPDRCPECGTVA